MLLLVACVTCILGAALAYVGVYLVTPNEGRRAAVRVAMPASRSPDAIADALYRAGVVRRPWLFAWLLALTGTAERVPRGVVPLRGDLTPRAVLRALASGAGLLRVTVPEGSSRFETARRLVDAGVLASAEEFVARTQDPALLARYGVRGDSLEGYLFPDTYDFPTGATVDEVIDRMVRTFRRRLGEVRARHPDAGAGRRTWLDERSLVILASLVEKETGAAEDRPRVAAVFWNRLELPGFEPRLLQSDPTIVYGCRVEHPPSCPNAPLIGRIPITRAMLEDSENRYNTYRHVGLPPGPICSPGARALEAVLAPAPTRDLYFVARGDGRSAFAATLAEHEANVQRYLRQTPGAAGEAQNPRMSPER